MADLSDTFNFGGILDEVDVPEELAPFMAEFLHRMDLFKNDLLNQLNKKDDSDTFTFTAIDSETADPIDISASGGTVIKET